MIVTMIVLSTSIRFIQERKSNKAIDILKELVENHATVLRRQSQTAAGVHQEILIKQLVPGDIVILSAGDMIPADCLLLSAKDLFISQSALTGES